MRGVLLALALALLARAVPAWAEMATPGAPSLHVSWGGDVDLALPLSRAVPWRAYTEDDPPRLVIDTGEVDWAALDPAPLREAPVTAIGTGRVAPGWTRLVLALEEPLVIGQAWMDADTATLRIEAEPGTGGDGPLFDRGWDDTLQARALEGRPRQDGRRPLVVALDPGHGGIDPGAQRGQVSEAELMLDFARELAGLLREAGHEAILTRDTDQFVALRGRPAMARAAGADIMLSLHADAVDGGGAEGATVYTLSAAGPDALSEELTSRQGTGDLLLGVDLPEAGDEIAGVLIELARLETAPRSDALAQGLVDRIGQAGLSLHKRPRLGADFTVLKAPDIPTVLVELGFMSSDADLANLTSRDWRTRMATALVRGIEAWAREDAAQAANLRR